MARSPKRGAPKTKSKESAAASGAPGGAHQDPMNADEAVEALGPAAEARPQPHSEVAPSDAVTGSPDKAAGETIRIGNREYAAGSRLLSGRKLNVLPDLPDVRDRIYEPVLSPLKPTVRPSLGFTPRDQGASSSCTGYALAHVIDCLTTAGGASSVPRVSARMLYEMAKRNDEWTGTAYDGSSVRGALSGFFRNGVCAEALAPDDGKAGGWVLTYEMAKQAREIRLGAYYRVQPDLSDYHAALNEIGVVYVSAQIHENWRRPEGGRIIPGGKPSGGHAFVVVGYDEEGFFILNSWGPGWGEGGVAHWSYADWAASVMDAWVLQLGVRAPTAFGAVPRSMPSGLATPRPAAAPNRGDIVGHFVNIDDGRYVTGGRYASPTPPEMEETVGRLCMKGSNGGLGYRHLVVYAHGGLNTLDDEANRIATWKRHDVFGRNGIYNFHLMWGSGFIDEVFGRMFTTETGRAGSVIGDLLFEAGAGKAIGSAAWRNMKQDAAAAFSGSSEYDGGFVGLAPLLRGLDRNSERPVLHFVGHSAGSIVLGRLLEALGRFGLEKIELGSIHLMAPACTVDFFKKTYGPYLSGDGALPLRDKIYLYCLSDALELADSVGGGGILGYGRSLLYLVSRAYEDRPNTPLAGMEIHASGLPQSDQLEVSFSPGKETRSTSHGGFDNDAVTLSTVMSRIVGGHLKHPPTKEELVGY